jgi:hypothetical protein
MKTYALYDMTDYECLVFMGTMKEVAEWTKTPRNNISSCMSRGLRVSHRYEVAVIEEKENEDWK